MTVPATMSENYRRYRRRRVGPLVFLFKPGDCYTMRRIVPWWKFWIVGKWAVVQNWDYIHPFLGFTKRRATAFIAERHTN